MSMRQRMKDANRLVKSKVYVLITDHETVSNGDLRGMNGFMKIHTLEMVKTRIEDFIKQVTKDEAKEAKNGGKRGGRPKGSKNKPKQVR